MSASSITILTFISVSLLTLCVGMLIYDWFFRYRLALQERLKELSGELGDNREISLFRDMKRLQNQETQESLTWNERLQLLVEQAGVQTTVRTVVGWSLTAGAIAAMAGLWWDWWLGALLVPFGAVLPFGVLAARKRLRQRKLSRQLPEAFAMISRAVRAGQTVPAAFQIIAEDFDAPISTEFARCYEQQNLGMSRETALRMLAKRTGTMELQIFVVAMLVQARSGGDLVELLDNLAGMIRKRLKLRDRVRALTGEGRMQALVLIVLPVAALLGVMLLSPEYAKELFDRPALLAGTAAAQAAGAFWIRRIINFDY
jgi:tight adherence protein B